MKLYSVKGDMNVDVSYACDCEFCPGHDSMEVQFIETRVYARDKDDALKQANEDNGRWLEASVHEVDIPEGTIYLADDGLIRADGDLVTNGFILIKRQYVANPDEELEGGPGSLTYEKMKGTLDDHPAGLPFVVIEEGEGMYYCEKVDGAAVYISSLFYGMLTGAGLYFSSVESSEMMAAIMKDGEQVGLVMGMHPGRDELKGARPKANPHDRPASPRL